MKNGIFENILDWSGKLNKCEKLITAVDWDGDKKIDVVCGDRKNSSAIFYYKNIFA